MKRILTVIGVTGLALLGATAPVTASPPEKVTLCHATGSATNPYVPVTIDLHGLNGHANSNHQNQEDIIPKNGGKVMPEGQNLRGKGQGALNNNCVPTAVPPVTPPVNPPLNPPVNPPAVTPVTPGETPSGAVVGAPAGAGAVAAPVAAPVATNPGFNVQTAVAGTTDVALAPWAAGIAMMLLAAAGVAIRQTLAPCTIVFRHRKE